MKSAEPAAQDHHTAYIGAGSNRGDRLANLRVALRTLQHDDAISRAASSPVYETEPVGTAGPGAFYNAVFRLDVRCDPVGLYRILHAIERALGRGPERDGPRTMDLDLLLFDDVIMESRTLTVPHPRMHERAFVLLPLADLAPDVVHPRLGLTVSELAAQLPESSGIIGQITEELAISQTNTGP